MGLFKIFKKTSTIDYSNAPNESLRAISMRFRGAKEDTVYVMTSNICPTCSTYNRRIFSLYGRYNSFSLLPDFLRNSTCPTCNFHIGFAHYFPGMNGNLKKDIAFSNRPFADNRTKREIDLWNERVANEQLNKKMEQDYSWILNNLPELAPKSIGGYKRMAKSNSSNYQKIVCAAKEKGYAI